MFADIIIDITHEKVFQYRIPPKLRGGFKLEWKL